ncbi:MAG: class I SAM-dependent methyltransferase [Flavobacterium sp.]|uniref:class I SAM-dependent methyltransferase n=1 Tax=Flavobacterium sp. TaxID=239 RepID=UPI0012269768|nr:class I SAM-dependent methyltransferase [Flavobacterium sp.]RZJ67914.1 MAG: class I SAM-dependent methyltransferase [Flavobacterium sp.]
MQQEYYREYYELERYHWWFTAREAIISGYISSMQKKGQLPQGALKILNVGCGPGRSSEYLSKFGEVTSIEYDAECCVFASELTGLNIQHGSITELQFPENTFDLVCAFDVIEHVEDDQLAVSELIRVAKNGANVFITIPTFMSLWSHHDVINHHFRRYRKTQIQALFAKFQGRQLFSSYFNFFLFPPIYAFRAISNMLKSGEKRTGSGSDFEAFKPGLLNKILFWVMRPEGWFMNVGLKFPFGVSILHSWKKGE